MRPCGPAAMASLLESGAPCCSYAAVQARPRPSWRCTFTDRRLRRDKKRYTYGLPSLAWPAGPGKDRRHQLTVPDFSPCHCRSQTAELGGERCKARAHVLQVSAAATEVSLVLLHGNSVCPELEHQPCLVIYTGTNKQRSRQRRQQRRQQRQERQG